MKVIASFIIITGLFIMFFPYFDNYYSSFQEERLLEKYAVQAQIYEKKPIIEKPLLSEYKKLERVFDNRETIETTVAETGANTSLSSSKEVSNIQQKAKHSDQNDILGILEIPKIDLRVPIVEGTTKSDLKYAAGHITGTSEIGEIGNGAIAAHRSYTFGKFFNRLDELAIGDEFIIELPTGNINYIVTKKFLVTPDDVSVLTPSQQDSIVTLITCHPMKNPTHRLIVQAKRK